MLNRTKVLTIGLGVTALAGVLLSFTNGEDDGKKKKYHVIHQKDGELTTYDTILPMSSDYTVENFLADKGIEDDDVKIIKVPAMGKHMMFHGEGMDGKPHVMVKEFKHEIEIDGEEGEEQEVRIEVEMDEDGNRTIKKWVNGEEVEMSEEDIKKMKMMHHGHGEHVMIHVEDGEGENSWTPKGEEHRVEIKVEIDEDGNKTMKKIVNGEEVEMSEEDLEKMHMHHKIDGEHMVIKMEMEEIEDGDMTIDLKEGEGEEVRIEVEMDDDGNKTIKKWVNGEEVELTEEDKKRIEEHKMHDGHGKMMMFHMDDSDMTEEEKEEMMRKIKEEMSNLHIEMDSLNGEIEIEIKEIMENMEIDGEEGNVFIHRIEVDDHHGKKECEKKCEGKEGHHKMRMMHRVHGDEDFTVVLVHEDMTEEELEAQEANMEVQREMFADEGDMIVFPNPNNGVFTIQFDQSEKTKTKVEILDAQGKVVFSDKLGKFSGTYKKEVDLKEHGAGMYIVNIQQGDDLKSHKIVVD